MGAAMSFLVSSQPALMHAGLKLGATRDLHSVAYTCSAIWTSLCSVCEEAPYEILNPSIRKGLRIILFIEKAHFAFV
jgi:hypothetical protein